MSETNCERCGKPRRIYRNMDSTTLTKCVLADFGLSADSVYICICSPTDNTLSYVTEVAPFTDDDWGKWNSAISRMKTSKVVVGSKLQLTEHGNSLVHQILEQYTRQETPDIIHAEPKEQNGTV